MMDSVRVTVTVDVLVVVGTVNRDVVLYWVIQVVVVAARMLSGARKTRANKELKSCILTSSL